MWAKASIFRIGPFWPARGTRTLVVDDGRVLTLDEPALIDEALALGDKLGGEANLQHQRDATTQTSGTLPELDEQQQRGLCRGRDRIRHTVSGVPRAAC
jgi:hypothetical protein